MAWGILEAAQPDVPGTTLLDDLHKETHQDVPYSSLKMGTGHSKHIVLVPQPSDDPNDPLNWPTWKRELCFWTITLMTGLVGACGPLLNSGYSVIAVQWGVSVNSVAASNGDLLLGLGCAMFFQSSLAVKFGRRPVFIVGAALLFFCSIWSAVSQGVTSFIASRVFQGIGMAPYEALVTATIGDLFFVHQRGMRITIWSFALIAGISITPIVNGYVVADDSLGWRWCFWLVIIFYGIGFIGVIFCVPETVFDRNAAYETDSGALVQNAAVVNQATRIVGTGHTSVSDVEKNVDNSGKETAAVETLERVHLQTQYAPRRTFWQDMKPWSGYYSPVSFWKIFLRPFALALSPATFCGFFVYGMTTCWIVVLSIVSSIIFATPPLSLSSRGTGNMSIGTFIASIIGALITGPAVDWLAVWASKRNNSIFEPEFRLILALPGFILCVASFGGWCGFTHPTSWVGPEMMYSGIYLGNGLVATAIVAYIIDVHRQTAAESFTIINFAKNMVVYGFSQFAADWVTSMELQKVLGILTGMEAICILFTLPLYIYGKRARYWMGKHPKWFTEKDY